MFYQWIKNKERTWNHGCLERVSANNKAKDGGNKPVLGSLEEVLADKIMQHRVMKLNIVIFGKSKKLEVEHESN